MKRLTAGVVAVAAALSLSTATASAVSSNDVDTANAVFSGVAAGIVNGVSGPHEGSANASSKMGGESTGSSKAWADFYGSSYKADLKNGSAMGQTADILWGVGIAAAVLAATGAAINSGVIPGLSLPQLHF